MKPPLGEFYFSDFGEWFSHSLVNLSKFGCSTQGRVSYFKYVKCLVLADIFFLNHKGSDEVCLARGNPVSV